jgi:hypothetical protein
MRQVSLKCLINLNQSTRLDGICGQLSSDGKKGLGFKSINDWTYIKDFEINQMQSPEYRFQAQILKDLELDLLRLPAFQTPITVLIKTIRLLGPLAQLEQLDV